MMIGLIFPKIAFLLLIFSGLTILSGLDPKRFEGFFKAVPGGTTLIRPWRLQPHPLLRREA